MSTYTIREISNMMGITPSTLRYYDKEGLLPDIKRKNGIRIFEEKDFRWLRLLNCLKNTNMPIKKIKEYCDLAKEGDSTLEERYKLILEQKENILNQIEQLKYFLQEVEFKEWYYKTAIEQGTEEGVMKNISDAPTLNVDKIPNTNRRKK